MKLKISIIFYLYLLVLVTGCRSNIETEWDCPAVRGKICHTISKSDIVKRNISSQQNNNLINLNNKIKPSNEQENLTIEKQPKSLSIAKRQGEKIARLWFAPYIDHEGNLHEASIIYIIEADNNWIIKP